MFLQIHLKSSNNLRLGVKVFHTFYQLPLDEIYWYIHVSICIVIKPVYILNSMTKLAHYQISFVHITPKYEAFLDMIYRGLILWNDHLLLYMYSIF